MRISTPPGLQTSNRFKLARLSEREERARGDERGMRGKGKKGIRLLPRLLTVDSVHCSDFRFLWQRCLFRLALYPRLPLPLYHPFTSWLPQLCISLDVCMFANFELATRYKQSLLQHCPPAAIGCSGQAECFIKEQQKEAWQGGSGGRSEGQAR